MNGLSVIKSALRLINVLAEGETPSPSESTDALESLNAMLDMWNAKRLNVFTIQSAAYTLVTTQQGYTFGTGGNFNAARPTHIEAVDAVLGDAGSATPATDKVRVPIEIIDAAQWGAIKFRTTAKSTSPEKVYPDYAFPLCNLKFWPIPTFAGTAPQVEIHSWTPLTAFADLTTAYTFPAAYELAIKTNLAILLAPEYQGAVVSPALVAQASESKTALQTVNAVHGGLSAPSAPQGATQ